jgi:hypothetical protein
MKRTVVRLPSEVVEHLDRLRNELRAVHPKKSYSRASVVRALVSSGLALADADDERLLDVARRAARS